jgi:hypothetical protein
MRHLCEWTPLAEHRVDQYRATIDSLDGLADEAARRRFEPINCISWIIGTWPTKNTPSGSETREVSQARQVF